MARLEGKTAIVTGAAQGLGLAIATRFAQEGARVMLVDRNADAVHRAASDLQQSAAVADVAVETDVKRFVAQTQSQFGRIDILVNNAGVFHGASILDLDEADFDRVMAINVKSMLFAIQAVAPHMLARKSGAIVNMASLAAMLGAESSLAYCVSKAAIVQLTNCAALAFASQNVRVNAIGPSTFNTDMARGAYLDDAAKRQVLSRTPMGRLGRPEEIAGVALFLASDDASYVTGKTIYVDGGRAGLNLTVNSADKA